ncbi:helix-hairpin-helix domain-containing protein [Cognatilysobacter segetis]|uniref:helix-hairpin-helix domain-containing protein n=1 Tax=Cognatilysobacter segetis TaxID=2492394 RepID=UPI00105F6E02|nr:helix-hairpin-helix domain-containing protein [Lysobacter segetis]
MNPARVDRARLRDLTDLPNVGPSIAGDLRRIGIESPAQLVGQSPMALYRRLCEVTGVRHDPCVLDVFMSVTRFMDGEPPQPWWAYTAERKARFGL